MRPRIVCAVAVAALLGGGGTSADPSYYYLNLYSDDDTVDYSCDFGSAGTSLVIAQVPPNTCFDLDHGETNTEDYVSIITQDGRMNEFRQLCAAPQDPNVSCPADRCKMGVSPVSTDTCIRAFDSSAVIMDHYCAGTKQLSPNLASFTISRFDNQRECSLERSGNTSGIAFIRNYDHSVLNQGCIADYSREPVERYISLTSTEIRGTTYYHGVIGCNFDNCTGGTCVEINGLAESKCLVTNTSAIKIERTTVALSTCAIQTTPSPGPEGNNYGNGADDDELIGIIVGGGAGIALLVFGVALLYRRFEYQTRRRGLRDYHTMKNSNYGAVSYDVEGMTTDI